VRGQTPGDDISRVRAGVSARSRAQDESVHLHTGRPHLSQGRGRSRDVHHCRRTAGGHQVRLSTQFPLCVYCLSIRCLLTLIGAVFVAFKVSPKQNCFHLA